MELNEIREAAASAAKEVLEASRLHPGDLFVVGCSSSEVMVFRRYVTTVARVMTKHTAMDMPAAVLNLLDTPRKGQTPRNCDNRILFTNIAEMMISIYSTITISPIIDYSAFFEVSFLKITIR